MSVQDRFYIEKEDRDTYSKIENALDMFNNKHNKDMFLFAMAYGFYKQARLPIKERENYFLTTTLTEEDYALINSVAMHETGEVVTESNRNEAYQICQEYANGGIKRLRDRWLDERGDIWKVFEEDLLS